MSNYKESAEVVKKHLDDVDLHYEMQDQGSSMTFTGVMGGFKGLYESFRYLLVVGDEDVQCYAVLPASAKDRLPQMAEFITRANYGLRFGAFEMDYDDGEVRFHLTLPMDALRADGAWIVALVGLPPKMLDSYSRGFMEVLMDLKTPSEAIKGCEGEK